MHLKVTYDMGQTPSTSMVLQIFTSVAVVQVHLKSRPYVLFIFFLISSHLVFFIAKKDDYTEVVRRWITGCARDATGLGLEQILVVFYKKLPQERHVVRL